MPSCTPFNKILENLVSSAKELQLGHGWIFQSDDGHKIKLLTVSSQSPDLNLWGEQKRRVHRRGFTVETLRIKGNSVCDYNKNNLPLYKIYFSHSSLARKLIILKLTVRPFYKSYKSQQLETNLCCVDL